MNREVHVRFWEGAGLRCPALLDYLNAYDSPRQARNRIQDWFDFYNTQRPHQSLEYRTPLEVLQEGEKNRKTNP
ncbi:MAG: integrase core domain-containing protein [Gammaproteobacteria bacterium]